MSRNSNAFKLAASITLPIIVSCTFVYIFYRQKKKFQSKSSIRQIKSDRGFTVYEDKNQGAVEVEHQASAWNSLGLEQPLVIAMVGLPARGKSYIVKMIIRYLIWTGFECEVFNVGSHRRHIGMASADAHFFDNTNKEAQQLRETMAMEVQDRMYSWLQEGEGYNKRVAIFDATNTTRARRKALIQRARRENVFLLFVESICDDQTVLERNYQLKLQNDDYKGMDPKKALADFIERVNAYEKVYETIADDEDNSQISYIKLVNVGQKVITSNCTGYLPSQVAFYLQNVHIKPRKIYLALIAEEDISDPDMKGVNLSENGRQYTLDLAKYVQAEQDTLKDTGREMLILTGTAGIHSETVLHLRMLFSCYNTPLLNELRAGDFQGLSKEQFKALHPEEYLKRENDKLNYRYPGIGGESYQDVIERIRPVIIELERQRRSVVVACHLAVLRCIYAYFMGSSREDIPRLGFRPNNIYKLTPGPFGCSCEEINPADELFHI